MNPGKTNIKLNLDFFSFCNFLQFERNKKLDFREYALYAPKNLKLLNEITSNFFVGV